MDARTRYTKDFNSHAEYLMSFRPELDGFASSSNASGYSSNSHLPDQRLRSNSSELHHTAWPGPSGQSVSAQNSIRARDYTPDLSPGAWTFSSNEPFYPWAPHGSLSTLNENGLLVSPNSSIAGESSYDGWDFSPNEGPLGSNFGGAHEAFLDFDFPHTLSADNLVLPSSNILLPTSTSPKISRSAPSSCLSTPSNISTDLSGIRHQSRDLSPSSSTDGDAQNPRRRFPCIVPGCTRRFTSQYTLKVHVEAHKPKPRVSFPCTLGCAERFSRQHDRLRHEVAKHGKVCEFLCDDCGRFFSSQKTLGNHKCPVAQGGTRWVNN